MGDIVQSYTVEKALFQTNSTTAITGTQAITLPWTAWAVDVEVVGAGAMTSGVMLGVHVTELEAYSSSASLDHGFYTGNGHSKPTRFFFNAATTISGATWNLAVTSYDTSRKTGTITAPGVAVPLVVKLTFYRAS